MAAWSTLIRSAGQNLQKTRILLPKSVINHAVANGNPARNMSGHNMIVQATRWQWDKTKDLIHFYILVAAIPLSILTFCVNVFVGPAQLSPTPEGYIPKHWEYYKSPITRFLARYIYHTPQKDYEKNLFACWQEGELIKVRRLEKKVWHLMSERQDYKYNYFLPYHNFAAREFREVVKRQRDNMM